MPVPPDVPRKRSYALVSETLVSSLRQRLELAEECGVFGVYTRSGHAPIIARKGIATLQHRGQEAAGESVWYAKGKMKTHVGIGLVPQVLTDDVIVGFRKSTAAIAHNRYTTNSKGDIRNAQPIQATFGRFRLSLAHNGNLFNTSWYKEVTGSIKTPGTSDSNKLAAYILWHRSRSSSWNEAVYQALTRVQHSGTFSGIVLTGDGDIFGIKDSRGIRPLCVGRLRDGWVIASESVAVDMVGGTYMRECKSGEIIHIRPDGTMSSSFYGTPAFPTRCALEDIYFSRPDSWNGSVRIREGRRASGVSLARRMKEKGIRPEVVIPIYDSGAHASKGMADGFGVSTVDAITTSHYVGRTFIIPGQGNRKVSVNGKHHVTPEGIQGLSAVAGDDSLVRGTTAPPLIASMRASGVKEAHVALASPPVTYPCDMGVDMPTKKELLASPYTGKPLKTIETKIAKKIHADTVTYLPIQKVAEAFGTRPAYMCFRCFGGPHPIRGKKFDVRHSENKLKGLPKIVVFISGSGTNLQQILDGVRAGDIKADIVGIVSNKDDAFGLTRAKRYKIPSRAFPSKGMLKTPRLRDVYEKQLLTYIREVKPNIIVLAGWMLLLSDVFLKRMRSLDITVINLHPALLTEKHEDVVATTCGNIPIMRGIHAIRDAYKSDIPVSGVTVHQVLPNNYMDTGPIIITEEVRKLQGENLAHFEARIHQAEYRVLPTALKRVLHVISHSVNTSYGDFPW